MYTRLYITHEQDFTSDTIILYMQADRQTAAARAVSQRQ